MKESHSFINRTIDSVVTALQTSLDSLQSDLASLRTASEDREREIQEVKTNLDNIKLKVNHGNRESADARSALRSALTQDINNINNDLANKLNNLTVELNLKIFNIMEEANVTEDDIDNLKVKVSDQKTSIDRVDTKTGENSEQIDGLEEWSETAGERVRNVTNMYTKLVLLTKSLLTNTTTDTDKVQEIMTSLEETMSNLQDSNIKEAIEGFNKTIQGTLSAQTIKYSEDITNVSASFKKLTEGLREFLYKSLGYVLVPSAGYYHVSSTALAFRWDL